MARNVVEHENRSKVYFGSLRRVTKIHSLIASDRYPSVDELAGELEVSRRTVLRDLEIMRDDLKAPIVYDRKRGGLRYRKPGWALPVERMTEGEMLAFFIAENALRLTGQTAEASRLKNVLARLAAQLPDQISVNLSALGEAVSFQNPAFVTVSPMTLQLLAKSAVEQATIEFDYYSPHKMQQTHRKADVHLLHNFAGDWYAVSYDHDARGFRDFHAGRMSNIKATAQYFEKQKGFDPNEYLKTGFSMMRGGKMTTVEIWFDPFQAQWIRERNYFHVDETRVELPDGSLRLSFKIGENGLEAVARFCLQYAGNCIAEKPRKLRQIIIQKLGSSIRQYDST